MILQSPTDRIAKENYNLKRYMYLNVHCSTIYNSEDMEATYMDIDRWMDKERVVYINQYSNITKPLKRMTQCHLQQHGCI